MERIESTQVDCVAGIEGKAGVNNNKK